MEKHCQANCFRGEEKTTSGVLHLGYIDQTKAKDVGERGRETMDRHFQERGGRGSCIASETLIPGDHSKTGANSMLDLLPLWNASRLMDEDHNDTNIIVATVGVSHINQLCTSDLWGWCVVENAFDLRFANH